MRDTSLLHPKLKEKLQDFLSECEKHGLKVGIAETLRTAAEQDALYAKGRTQPGKIVTNAKGSSYSSMHQWGVAFDIYRNDGKGAYNTSDGFFEKAGKIGESIGLIWGGSWKGFADMPHFQLPDWGNTPAKLKKQYTTPENFFKTWEENAMTKEERTKFNMLVLQVERLSQKVDSLEKRKEKVYHYTNELPDWARPTIQKLLDKGIYKGAAADDLNLPTSLMRELVINDRLGMYK